MPSRARLDPFVVVPAGESVSTLERLRRAPTRASTPTLVEVLKRLGEVRALGAGALDVAGIPVGQLKTLARYAATTWAPVLARMPADRRTTTPVASAPCSRPPPRTTRSTC